MKKPLLLSWILLTWLAYPVLIRRPKNSKHILVMPQYSRIGDIVCSTGVFVNIKEKYPESRITVLMSKRAFGILKYNERISDFIFIEDYTILGLIRRIQKENFDYSINLSATSVNTCLSVWGRIPHRIKTVVEEPPITERLTDWMSNHRLLYKNHTYLPQHHIELLRFLDIQNPEDKKEVWLSPHAEEKAEIWRNSISQKCIIGISITAGNKIKEFGDERFGTLIKKLLTHEDTFIVCIGSHSDDKRIEALIRNINSSRCIKATDLSLEELPSYMKRFSLYIGVDTGPIYIAHALGVPLIDIIGPVDPSEQPPQDAKSIQILPKDVEPSSFVFKRRGSPEQIRNALDSISVDEVYEQAVKLLSL